MPDALKDELLCGLANAYIQQKLFSEDGLTMDTTVAVAVVMDSAAKDALELKEGNGTTSAQPVNQVHTKNSDTPMRIECYRCTSRHDPKDADSKMNCVLNFPKEAI